MLRRFMPGDWIALAVLALAGIVWAVRLEGRQNALNDRVDDVQVTQKERYDELLDELRYVRMRLDQALASRGQ